MNLPSIKQYVPFFQEKISFSETIEIILTKTGHDLRQIIAEKLGLPAQRLKIICRGHVINLTTSLQDQNVKVRDYIYQYSMVCFFGCWGMGWDVPW